MEIMENGRLAATLKRQGGGRPGAPVVWLVYWGLRYSHLPVRRFPCQRDAAAWVKAAIL